MFHQLSVLKEKENIKSSQIKKQGPKPCLYYYTGGRGRTGVSLRTLVLSPARLPIPATPANSNWGSWFEPACAQSQSPLPYRLAIPQ